MRQITQSIDGLKISYTESGTQAPALVFVHGWLGNADWWLAQEQYFKHKYNIVRIDLGGHGQSDHHRANWTHTQYADDIVSVLNQLTAQNIILIGHSMAGAFVLEASQQSEKVRAIILVDTLKDLDQVFTLDQAEQMLFKQYRENFQFAVENILPQYLYCSETPIEIQKQLNREFLSNQAEFAINALRPLYAMDVQKFAKLVKLPVRAINSDASPTHLENNRKYFQDYAFKTISGTGHYPMLEKSSEFNQILEEVLETLS